MPAEPFLTSGDRSFGILLAPSHDASFQDPRLDSVDAVFGLGPAARVL